MELLLILIFPIVLYIIFRKPKRHIKLIPLEKNQKEFLNETVEFYRELDEVGKEVFEARVQLFIATTRINGVNTQVNAKDKLLVASSAIIPVFEFPTWEYRNLNEVLLYPSSFNEDFSVDGGDKRILGMVGSGTMEGKMILSKPALYTGFKNSNDKRNVGIHEFIHLIDKSDGQIDGIPSALLEKQYTIPWLNLIKSEMDAIHRMRSDINSYGGVSKEEFFPVISEYFFERPKLLKTQHPELYELLIEIFTTDLAKKYKGIKRPGETGRNDSCPCGSGKKYKKCCLES